jgi:UDP-N-acetylglucosamine:LPS N-acetylglucosamine transferase
VSGTPSILFAMSDTGGGHRAAAIAIAAAIEQLAGSKVDRAVVDMLVNSGVPFFRTLPDRYYDMSTRLLPLNDLLFELTDGPLRIDTIMHAISLSADPNIRRVLEETRPNVVVSLHPLVSRLIGNARRTYRLSFHLITVVTELVRLHAAWADPESDLCIAPTAEAYARLQKHGIPKYRLMRTGFPVHPKFAAYTGTRRDARASLDIDLDAFTLLLSSGSAGAGSLRELAVELARTYPAQQLLVVTGKNEALCEELRALGLGPKVYIYGFVNSMEELMAASDIVISKAGPGILMEAMVMQRPVIVTEAVGAQELGNIDFVLNHELGAFCPTIDRIIAAITELTNPEAYAATVARQAEAIPRDGALQIAHILLHQLQLPPPRIRRRQLINMAKLPRFSTQRMRLLPIRPRRRKVGRKGWRLDTRRLPHWGKRRRSE